MSNCDYELVLKYTLTNEDTPSISEIHNQNMDEIMSYLNCLRLRVDQLEAGSEIDDVTKELINEVISERIILRLIPVALTDGGTFAYDDGNTITRNGNRYTITTSSDAGYSTVTIKDSQKTVTETIVGSVGTNILVTFKGFINEDHYALIFV